MWERNKSAGASDKSVVRLSQKANRVAAKLQSRYGSPNHNNKQDPLDELVFIVLSQMTSQPSYERTYDKLKAAAPDWDTVRRMRLSSLRKLIRGAGLSAQKAPRIKAILESIHRDFGITSLESLFGMRCEDAEKYLCKLPGVHLKTAKCVLMYAVGLPVLPVDTHVLRVAKRLALLPESTTLPRANIELEGIVAPELRYSFHVNALSHGREVCTANKPRCGDCPVKNECSSSMRSRALQRQRSKRYAK